MFQPCMCFIFSQKEDMLHNKTRVDHHEDEIKKLRARIDELKMKLTTAEDEVIRYIGNVGFLEIQRQMDNSER